MIKKVFFRRPILNVMLVCLLLGIILVIGIIVFSRNQSYRVSCNRDFSAIMASWFPVLDTAISDHYIALGEITYKKAFFSDKVPVKAVWIVVDKALALTPAGAQVDRYVLWAGANSDSYVGNIVQPCVVKFYHPVTVHLSKSSKAYISTIDNSKVDEFPLSGSFEFEFRE